MRYSYFFTDNKRRLLQKLLLQLIVISIFLSCVPENIEPTEDNYIIQGPQDLYPSFSKDGIHIAYYHDSFDETIQGNYERGLYTIRKDGTDRKLILAGFFQSPSWSPDGNWLTFSNAGSIVKCKLYGDSLTRFNRLDSLDNPGNFFPSWTKDGEFIIFDKALNPGYGIYRTSKDFKKIDALFGLELKGRDPELAKDGVTVLYQRGGIDVDHMQIFKANLNSNIEIQLTNNTKDNRAPTWSHDGTKIAWSANLELYVMDENGDNVEKIGYGSDPSWSPLNDVVASHANEDFSKAVLYVIWLDGSRTQVTF